MQTVYAIIKALQSAPGDLAKQAILDSQVGNVDLAEYLKAVYDPAISYYQKKLPKTSVVGTLQLNGQDIEEVNRYIAKRVMTGNKAKDWLKKVVESLDAEGQELLTLMFNRKIGADVGDTMVLKAFPGLYFVPPYQRCSLMDAKAKARFAKLDYFYVQTKADGSFAYVLKRLDGTVDVITRQGNSYPQAFAQELAKDVPAGWVLIGELEVTEPAVDNAANRVLLDRKTGNGILSSVQKDGEGLLEGQKVHVSAWDMLTEAEFVAGKSERTYDQRWHRLKAEMDWIEHQPAQNIFLIHTEEVGSLDEAFVIYTDHTSRGLEGCIAKDPASLWKDGTAKDIVKMKLKFEAEYRCRGVIEGEGKAKGMVGAIQIETEDGLLECNCGTGFSDKQRKEFFDNPELIVGEVVMLSANDIIQSRDARKKPALSLPVFEEVRYDKKSVGANTLPEVQAILAAAKAGK